MTPDEELLLAEIPDQKPLGLVHTSEDARAARHLGVVFQVEITNANTAEALHKKTIVERPEKHVRTEWMTVPDLRRRRDKQREWSVAISDFLSGSSVATNRGH